MFVDTHSHLFSEQFDEDRFHVVNSAINLGVEKILLPNIDASTIGKMNQLADAFPNNCYPMIGLHPGYVDANWEWNLDQIRKALNERSYIAIGEIGMDLYWDKTFVEEQKEVFRTQIKWAKEFELPIAIHARDAFEEIFEIIEEMNSEKLKGVFHCFTGTIEDALRIKKFEGFKLGIGGVVTYKNSALIDTLSQISIDELILETDSPYLPPVPHRGKRNESSYLLHVAEKLSDIYQIPLKKIEEITTKNAVELFNIPL